MENQENSFNQKIQKHSYKFGLLEWTKAILGIFVIVVLPFIMAYFKLR